MVVVQLLHFSGISKASLGGEGGRSIAKPRLLSRYPPLGVNMLNLLRVFTVALLSSLLRLKTGENVCPAAGADFSPVISRPRIGIVGAIRFHLSPAPEQGIWVLAADLCEQPRGEVT